MAGCREQGQERPHASFQLTSLFHSSHCTAPLRVCFIHHTALPLYEFVSFITLHCPSTHSFFFLPFIFISWRLITLQYCSGFCHSTHSHLSFCHLGTKWGGGGRVNGGDPCALVYKEARLPGSESQLLCMSWLKSLNLCRPTTHMYHWHI